MTPLPLGTNLLHAATTTQFSDAISAPVLLTAQPLLRRRAELAACLRAVPFNLRLVARWDRLLDGVERIAADIVLVDLDDANVSAVGMSSMSGYRLVTLLTRRLAGGPTTLIVITRLDFSEIEDLARGNIHALISPEITTKDLVSQIRGCATRVCQQHASGNARRTAHDSWFPASADAPHSDHADTNARHPSQSQQSIGAETARAVMSR